MEGNADNNLDNRWFCTKNNIDLYNLVLYCRLCYWKHFFVLEKKNEETIVEKGVTEEPVTNPIAEGNPRK